MAVSLTGIAVENFKSYDNVQWIDLSDLSVLMGANSSGKSTALQTLLILKQTMECNSPNIDMLLSGKYVTLGDFKDIVNNIDKKYIQIGISLQLQNELGNINDKKNNKIFWRFQNTETEQETGKIVLSEIEFQINDCCMKLVLEDDSKYYIWIDGVKTQLLTEVHNLQMGKMFVEYDEELNALFHRFLNELLTILTQKKKITSIEKSEIMALNGIETFFYRISKEVPRIDKQEKLDENSLRLADKVLDLIEEYGETEYREYKRFDSLPPFIKQGFLAIAIQNLIAGLGTSEDIDSAIKSYSALLSEYRGRAHDNVRKSYSGLNVNYLKMQKDIRQDRKSDMDIITSVFITYKQFLNQGLGKVFYIGPIREKPLGMYNIGFEAIPKYVGTTGAYFASVLLHENKKKEYLFPNDEKEESSLWEALDAWALHLNVANEIQVEQRNSFGFSVSVANTQNRTSDIMNVGIGTSQVLPVLITGLLSEIGETLIFEQPELHLHPFSQSRLADFFVALAKNGRKVIVETHSEYMILRLRYHVLTEHIHEDQLAVNFFQNSHGTQVKKGMMNPYGNLEYPDDFKDETQELMNDLMNAALVKGRRNGKEFAD